MRPVPIEVNPYETVTYNGDEVRIVDLPAGMAALHGYGHGPTHGREVIPGAYPYKPDTCRRADWGQGSWLFGGTVLICTGCGLDFT